MTQLDEVKQVKDQVQDDLLAKSNVVGVGTGIKSYNGRGGDAVSIVALVTEKRLPDQLDPRDMVPPMIAGIPTDVVEVGELKAQQSTGMRWRPAIGGVSIGHPGVTSGTLGAIVFDRKSGEPLILSNNHIMAHNNRAALGDAIIQPGRGNGGDILADRIARLTRYIPIQFDGEPRPQIRLSLRLRIQNFLARALGIQRWLAAQESEEPLINVVDAALARPYHREDVKAEIMGIGKVSGVLLPALNMSVRKSGCSSGVTSGHVTLLDTTVTVTFEETRQARFEHQILTSSMSDNGDSGSLLVAGEPAQAVGLLFAGSNKVSIFNPIQTVLDLLEVSL